MDNANFGSVTPGMLPPDPRLPRPRVVVLTEGVAPRAGGRQPWCGMVERWIEAADPPCGPRPHRPVTGSGTW
ncbi:hypothetical protein GCM10009818_05680 [Nakamurella flavida]